MNKKQKQIILFSLLFVLWLGAIGAIVIGILLKDNLSGDISLIIGTILSPLLSQWIGILPKVIHYQKIKKLKDEINNKVKRIDDKEIKDRKIF